MPNDTRIAVLVLLPDRWRPPRRRVDRESLMELRRFAEDLRSEGIWLIPFPPGPPWHRFFPFDVDELVWLLERESIDWREFELWWHRWVQDWPESEVERSRDYRMHFREVLYVAEWLIERRLVSGVVIPWPTGLEEEHEDYELQQRISEFLPPRSVLHLEIGRPVRKEPPLFPGIRFLRYPESRDEIIATLRSFARHRGEAAAPPPSTERAPVEAEAPREPEPKPQAPTAAEAELPAPSTPVHLGVSAPTKVRPGDEFTARFSAYHPAFAKVAKKALRQPYTKSYPDQVQTAWKLGEEVCVVLVGEHMTVSPYEQKFTWDGKHKTVQFDVRIDDGVVERRRVLLRFDVYIQEAVVARVRLPLTIDSKPGFLARILEPEEQFLAQLAPQTAYASYEITDKTEVLQTIDAILAACWDSFLHGMPVSRRKQGKGKGTPENNRYAGPFHALLVVGCR